MKFIQSSSLRRFIGAGMVVLAIAVPASVCQTSSASAVAPAAQAAAKPSDILQPALSRISQTIAGLNISRWKAPGQVRSATQQNTDSIQRDLNSTLPGLLTAADAAPRQVSAVFPAYRNIDALYDVLLRVAQTADLAAPENEAASISDALSHLESARNQLGNSILNASKNTEAEVVQLRVAVQKEAAAKAAAPPKTIIVDDGPAKSTARSKRKRRSTTAPANQSQQPQQ